MDKLLVNKYLKIERVKGKFFGRKMGKYWTALKNRPCDPYATIYKWDFFYKLILTREDWERLYGNNSKYNKIRVKDLAETILNIIPPEAIIVFRAEGIFDDDSVNPNTYWALLPDVFSNEKEIHVYFNIASNAIPCKNTPKELRIKKEVAENKDRAAFNAVVFKDNIVEALAQHGYKTHATTDTLFAYTTEDWNKLISDALEYYCNDKLFKELHCILRFSKVSKTRGITKHDGIFNLHNIYPDFTNEGEQNGDSNTNN